MRQSSSELVSGARDVEQRMCALAERAGVPAEHVLTVRQRVVAESGLTEAAVEAELEWFYCQLGLGEVYFQATKADNAAAHLQSLHASKMLARTSGSQVDLRLQSPGKEGGLYACPDLHEEAMRIELMVEARYPQSALQSYRTGPRDASLPLRTYVVSSPDFVEADPPAGTTELHRVSCRRLLARIGDTTRGHYQRLLDTANGQLGPAIETLHRPDKGAQQLLVCFRRGTTHSYFSAISDILESHGTRSINKYIAQFSNGFTIYSIYLPGETSEAALENLREDVSQLYLLPHSSLTPLFREGLLTAQEVAYAYAGWKFTHQFLTRYNDVYAQLAQAFADDPHRRGLLAQLKHRLSKDTFTEDRIFETIVAYPQLVKALYADFEAHHGVHGGAAPPPMEPEGEGELRATLSRAVSSEIDRQVLEAFLTFNHHVLATNFYKTNNVALSFRLDPAFLSDVEYPEEPFGIYFFVGAEFRGFHVRFRDIARGGIRIISSPNAQAYKTNVDRLFNENYDLAHTQQRKNKDIPEGGSKGTILLSPEHLDKAESAFRKYVDSMLDLLMPDEQVASRLPHPEILFLGPDEGTAELMDWASTHARGRGYRYWKAFTTGKSVTLGGIPHDTYGMTTRSVHQFVLGILAKLGIDEESITKTQTGGPDGDLGSNEVLISKDKTLTVIDGSGVLHDPAGIDRGELSRLARERKMVSHFDRGRIGAGGFLVSVDDNDVTLPDGRRVDSGFAFRNGFHLDPLAGADLFVPCGGRPSSVHINNVDALLDDEGRPRFRFIVEGANLFLTQDARLYLEKQGVVVIKDASANKGGVTSSSQEVLAALALDDETFATHMTVRDGVRPDFYQRYVTQVQERLEQNARDEFECLWREHERTGRPRSLLTDEISVKINDLNDLIQTSALWDNLSLRRKVLERSCPPALLDEVSLDELLERLPKNYQQAVVGAYLASHYVYQQGLSANEVSFVAFLEPFLS